MSSLGVGLTAVPSVPVLAEALKGALESAGAIRGIFAALLGDSKGAPANGVELALLRRNLTDALGVVAEQVTSANLTGDIGKISLQNLWETVAEQLPHLLVDSSGNPTTAFSELLNGAITTLFFLVVEKKFKGSDQHVDLSMPTTLAELIAELTCAKAPDFSSLRPELIQTVKSSLKSVLGRPAVLNSLDSLKFLSAIVKVAEACDLPETLDDLAHAADRISLSLGSDAHFPRRSIPTISPLPQSIVSGRDVELSILHEYLLSALGTLQVDCSLEPGWHGLLRETPIEDPRHATALVGLAKADLTALGRYLPELISRAVDGDAPAIVAIGELLTVGGTCAGLFHESTCTGVYDSLLAAIDQGVADGLIILTKSSSANMIRLRVYPTMKD